MKVTIEEVEKLHTLTHYRDVVVRANADRRMGDRRNTSFGPVLQLDAGVFGASSVVRPDPSYR